jgi:tetratricopeptide (TPR) repeat protein
LKKPLAIVVIIGLCACGQAHKKSKREILETQAYYYYDHDFYYLAKIKLTALIGLDSTKGEYYFKRGYCYDQLNRTTGINDYKKAIELDYRVSDAYRHVAFDEMQSNNDSLAIICFVKAIQVDSTQSNELTPWIKICQSQIEFQKTEAWKEYEEYRKGTQQRSTLIKVNK